MNADDRTLDIELMLLDFPREFAEDRDLALLHLRLLLLDERLCRLRLAWLTEVRGAQPESSRNGQLAKPASGRMTAHTLIRLINQYSDAGVEGQFDDEILEQIHHLTCDADGLLTAHRLLCGLEVSPSAPVQQNALEGVASPTGT